MNQTLHIIRKDARHLRWYLAGWLLIIAAHVGLTLTRSSIELQGFAFSILIAQLTSLTAFLEIVMMALVVSRIVHEDPAVGNDAFWLTRPLDPGALTLAKLALATGVLILLPLAAEIATMAAFRVSVRDMWRAAPPIVLGQAAWVFPLTAAAVLTPTITRYMLLIVAAIGAFVLLVSATLAFALLFTSIQTSSPRPEATDALPSVIGSAALIAISLWAVSSQYRHRRLKRTGTIAAAGMTAALVAPMFWPWHLAGPPDPDPGAWAHDEARTRAVYEPAPPQISEEFSLRRRNTARKQIAVPARLTGLPSDVSVRSVEVRSRLETPDTSLESTSSQMMPVRRPATSGADRQLGPLQAALGGVRIVGRDLEDTYDEWPVLLVVGEDELARYGGVAGRLTTALDFHLQRSTPSGTVRLVEGATLGDDRRRLEIVRVQRRIDGCSVMLREIAIDPLLSTRTFESEQFVLRNAVRGEAVTGQQEETAAGSSSSPLSFLLAVTLGMHGSAASAGRGFNVRSYAVRYPDRNPMASSRPVIDDAWLNGAELVRVQSRYAGHVSRSLTIDGFKMIQ
jgi:hypothetical protein